MMESSSPSEQPASCSDPFLPPEIECEHYDDLEARLPAEIECYIFQLAYHNRSGAERTTLLRVAKRVSEWLIPLIYGYLIVVQGKEFPPEESLRKYGHHVQHFCMESSSHRHDGDKPFSLCPNVHDLVSWEPTILNPDLIHLTIKRLGLYSVIDLNSEFEKVHDPDRIQRWWSNITHLTLGDVPESNIVSPSLRLLPNLTHLTLGSWSPQSVVSEAFGICPKLEILIWVLTDFQSDDTTFVVDPNVEEVSGFEDVRVVTIDANMSEDWVRGARGEDDMWILAERKVKERKALLRRR